MRKKEKKLIGIDEAGRGPIAGPVSVGVALIPTSSYTIIKMKFKRLTDSKLHTEKEREEWYQKLLNARKEGILDFAVGFSSAEVIDKKGIVYAVQSAMKKALKKISLADPYLSEVRLDGSLKAPLEFSNQKTIIGGDRKEKIISIASIAAKVERDRLMKRLSKKYNHYNLEIHKGYGTKKHFELIKKHGTSKIHRISFLKKKLQKINFLNESFT